MGWCGTAGGRSREKIFSPISPRRASSAHRSAARQSAASPKTEGKEAPQPAEGEAQQPSQVVDLMAALNASVKRARESRGETDDHATVHEMMPRKKAAAKKTPAQKPVAKKTATKKTAAKMNAGRKPRSA